MISSGPAPFIGVVGEALVDVIRRPTDRDRGDASSDGASTEDVVHALGGGPFNVARTVARLGRRVAFFGALSTDALGARLKHQLEGDGVDLIAASETALPTTTARATIDAHGDATYDFRIAGTSAPSFTLSSHGQAVLEQLDALHVGSLGLVFEPLASTVEAMVERIGRHVLVMIDPNCRPAAIEDRSRYVDRWTRLARRADVVKASVPDLRYLSGGLSAIDAAAQLIELGVAAVVITAGAAPTRVVTQSLRLEFPVAPIEVVDTIGAGDAFGGAFLARWTAEGLTRADLTRADQLGRAVRDAQLVAAITCSRVGADPPLLADLGAPTTVPSEPSPVTSIPPRTLPQ